MTNVRVWALGFAALALGLWLLGVGSLVAADDALGKDVLKLAEAIQKDAAKAQKDAEALGKKTDIDVVMELYKPRGKGNGLGVDKPVPAKEDGIEKKIQAMDKKPMAPATLKDEAAAIAKMAYVTAAIADMIHNNVPPKEKKKEKEWQKFTAEMKASSLELAKELKGDKANPANVHKIAQKLNNACIGCHDVFR